MLSVNRINTSDYYAHGKLLLTGEYFVLDGATALAVPTKLGQRFTVSEKPATEDAETVWNIRYPTGTQDLSIRLYAADWRPTALIEQNPLKARLLQLIKAIQDLGVDSRAMLTHRQIDCYLEFPPDWGLGSSSTLVHFLATYFGVDQYALLAATFGGSGYDLACAGAAGALLYRRATTAPRVTPLDWQPEWLKQTYFVHLNRKQNSREGITAYRKVTVSPKDIAEISQLTLALTEPSLHLRAAARLIDEHEALVAGVLGIERVREQFDELPGTIKSLGAWGGDFVWVLSEQPAEKVRAYFNARGYATFIPYHDMAL